MGVFTVTIESNLILAQTIARGAMNLNVAIAQGLNFQTIAGRMWLVDVESIIDFDEIDGKLVYPESIISNISFGSVGSGTNSGHNIVSDINFSNAVAILIDYAAVITDSFNLVSSVSAYQVPYRETDDPGIDTVVTLESGVLEAISAIQFSSEVVGVVE